MKIQIELSRINDRAIKQQVLASGSMNTIYTTDEIQQIIQMNIAKEARDLINQTSTSKLQIDTSDIMESSFLTSENHLLTLRNMKSEIVIENEDILFLKAAEEIERVRHRFQYGICLEDQNERQLLKDTIKANNIDYKEKVEYIHDNVYDVYMNSQDSRKLSNASGSQSDAISKFSDLVTTQLQYDNCEDMESNDTQCMSPLSYSSSTSLSSSSYKYLHETTESDSSSYRNSMFEKPVSKQIPNSIERNRSTSFDSSIMCSKRRDSKVKFYSSRVLMNSSIDLVNISPIKSNDNENNSKALLSALKYGNQIGHYMSDLFSITLNDTSTSQKKSSL